MSTKAKSVRPESVVPQEPISVTEGPTFDEADYRALIIYCKWLLLRYCQGLHQNLTDAYDLAQQALMRCLKGGRFDNAPIPLSYVKAAAKHYLLNQIRYYNRHPVTSLTQWIDEEKENGHAESKLIADLSWKTYKDNQYLEAQKELLDELIAIAEMALKKFDYTDAQLLGLLLQGYSITEIANKRDWVLETFKKELDPEIVEKHIEPRVILLRKKLIYRAKQIRKQWADSDNDGDDGGTTPRPRRNRQKKDQVKKFRYSLVKIARPDKKGGTIDESDREYALSVPWSDEECWEIMCKVYQIYIERRVWEQKERPSQPTHTKTSNIHIGMDFGTLASIGVYGTLPGSAPEIYHDRAGEIRSDVSRPDKPDGDGLDLNSMYDPGVDWEKLRSISKPKVVNIEQARAVNKPTLLIVIGGTGSRAAQMLVQLLRLGMLAAEVPFSDEPLKTQTKTEVNEKCDLNKLADKMGRATALSHDGQGSGVSDLIAAWRSDLLRALSPDSSPVQAQLGKAPDESKTTAYPSNFDSLSHIPFDPHKPETTPEHLSADKRMYNIIDFGVVRIRDGDVRTRPPEYIRAESIHHRTAGNTPDKFDTESDSFALRAIFYKILMACNPPDQISERSHIKTTVISAAQVYGEMGPVAPHGAREQAVALIQAHGVEPVSIYDDAFHTGDRFLLTARVAMHNGAALQTEAPTTLSPAAQAARAAASTGNVVILPSRDPAYWQRYFPQSLPSGNPISTVATAAHAPSNLNTPEREHSSGDYARLCAAACLKRQNHLQRKNLIYTIDLAWISKWQKKAKVWQLIIDYQRLQARLLLQGASEGEHSARPLLFSGVRKSWKTLSRRTECEPISNPNGRARGTGHGYRNYRAVIAGGCRAESHESKRPYATDDPCLKEVLFDTQGLRLEIRDFKTVLADHCVRLRLKRAENDRQRSLPELMASFRYPAFCNGSASFHSAPLH
ncbi:MAG: hypothetical protein WBV94_26155 [Blastocatellia bacterium]